MTISTYSSQSLDTLGYDDTLVISFNVNTKEREGADADEHRWYSSRRLSENSNFLSDRGKLEKITAGIELIFRG